jgi:hypothetical protein
MHNTMVTVRARDDRSPVVTGSWTRPPVNATTADTQSGTGP